MKWWLNVTSELELAESSIRNTQVVQFRTHATPTFTSVCVLQLYTRFQESPPSHHLVPISPSIHLLMSPTVRFLFRIKLRTLMSKHAAMAVHTFRCSAILLIVTEFFPILAAAIIKFCNSFPLFSIASFINNNLLLTNGPYVGPVVGFFIMLTIDMPHVGLNLTCGSRQFSRPPTVQNLLKKRNGTGRSNENATTIGGDRTSNIYKCQCRESWNSQKTEKTKRPYI